MSVWELAKMFSAESGDRIMETESQGGAGGEAEDVTIQSDYVQTGTYGYKFDFTSNGNCALLPVTHTAVPDYDIWALYMAIGVSAAPTAEAGIFQQDVTAHGSAIKYIRIGTDRKLRFYSKDGVQVGSATTTLVPIDDLQDFVIIWDFLTLSTVYMHVFAGDTEELAFDTGLAPADFMTTVTKRLGAKMDAGSNLGYSLYVDDAMMRTVSTAAEAPSLVQWPRLRANGYDNWPPDDDGTYEEWTGSPDDTDEWTNIDEAGDNDGATTHLGTYDNSAKSIYKAGGANVIPGGASVEGAQMGGVVRVADAGKAWGTFWCKTTVAPTGEGASYPWSSTPSTTWVGRQARVPRPSGSWTEDDGDPDATEFGVLSASEGDVDANATKLGWLWIYYTDTLPLGTTPAAAAYAHSFGVVF